MCETVGRMSARPSRQIISSMQLQMFADGKLGLFVEFFRRDGIFFQGSNRFSFFVSSWIFGLPVAGTKNWVLCDRLSYVWNNEPLVNTYLKAKPCALTKVQWKTNIEITLQLDDAILKLRIKRGLKKRWSPCSCSCHWLISGLNWRALK